MNYDAIIAELRDEQRRIGETEKAVSAAKIGFGCYANSSDIESARQETSDLKIILVHSAGVAPGPVASFSERMRDADHKRFVPPEFCYGY